MEDIQKQEQRSREAVQSQMKDLLRTPSSSSETEATSGESVLARHEEKSPDEW